MQTPRMVWDEMMQTLLYGHPRPNGSCRSCGKPLNDEEQIVARDLGSDEPVCFPCLASVHRARDVRDERHLQKWELFVRKVWPITEDGVIGCC